MISAVIVSCCWLPTLPHGIFGGSSKRPGLGSVKEKMLQSVVVVLESKSESCTGKLLYAGEG